MAMTISNSTSNFGGFHFYSNREYLEMLPVISGTKLKELAEQAHHEQLKREVENGFTSSFMRIDQHMSGAADQSLAMRCTKGLKALGISDDTRKDGYIASIEATNRIAQTMGIILNMVLDRDLIKEAVIPHFYNGEHRAEEVLGPDGAKAFNEAYAGLFPGAEQFRIQLRDCWHKTPTWSWELPDGYQVCIPVMGVPEEDTLFIGGKSFTVRYSEMTGRAAYSVSGTRIYRTPGTLALAANVTHSIDAYVKREIIRRAHMTRAHAEYILSQCENAPHWSSYPIYERLLDDAYSMGIVSTRFLYLLEEMPVKLPEGILAMLKVAMERLPSRSFDVLAVHDEFAAKLPYINSLRIQANEVFASLYAGTIPNYLNKVFGTKLVQSKFDRDTWMTIRNNNHLLRI